MYAKLTFRDGLYRVTQDYGSWKENSIGFILDGLLYFSPEDVIGLEAGDSAIYDVDILAHTVHITKKLTRIGDLPIGTTKTFLTEMATSAIGVHYLHAPMAFFDGDEII